MTELRAEYDDVYERLTKVTGELAQTVSLLLLPLHLIHTFMSGQCTMTYASM